MPLCGRCAHLCLGWAEGTKHAPGALGGGENWAQGPPAAPWPLHECPASCLPILRPIQAPFPSSVPTALSSGASLLLLTSQGTCWSSLHPLTRGFLLSPAHVHTARPTAAQAALYPQSQVYGLTAPRQGLGGGQGQLGRRAAAVATGTGQSLGMQRPGMAGILAPWGLGDARVMWEGDAGLAPGPSARF